MKNGLIVWQKNTQLLKASCYAGGLVLLINPAGRIQKIVNFKQHKTAKILPDPVAGKRKIKRSLLKSKAKPRGE